MAPAPFRSGTGRGAALLLITLTAPARAEGDAGGPVYETVVTAATPIHGSGLPLDHIPSNVQTGDGAEIAAQGSLDVSEHLARAFGSVFVNATQNSPLQPDLQYRGFLASPLLGAPQGMSVYLDGMRLNEPFGDTVNWDLIPTNAIASINLMPGSNPLFGLNTLGGALSLETRTGFSAPGVGAHLAGGAVGRRIAAFEGGQHGDHFGLFVAASTVKEDGWRDFSPSSALSAFATGSYLGTSGHLELSLAVADTDLTGNGAAPAQLLRQDRKAVFTHPDQTKNQLALATLRGGREMGPSLRISGSTYYRHTSTATLNGDSADWRRCETPGLTTFVCGGDRDDPSGGKEVPVVDGQGRKVPFDATYPYDGGNNRTRIYQDGFGAAAQLALETPVLGHENHLFAGAAIDLGFARFSSGAELARLSSTRGTLGSDIVDPGSRVGVNTTTRTLGLFASEILAIRHDLYLTLSGRFNTSHLSLEDQIGDDLDGEHSFARFNPSLGLSYQPRAWLGVFGNYSEAARNPTPLELTCANADAPCRLPNDFVADPPLAQVVARTMELGVRGRWSFGATSLSYDAAAFRTRSSHDILFISAGPLVNTGYFANVGQTERQGLETNIGGSLRLARLRSTLSWSLHYTLLDATFRSAFKAPSAHHPDAVDGSIDVEVGARLPTVPRHLAKGSLTWTFRDRLRVGGDLMAQSDQILRGDEANLLSPLPGFAIVDLRAQLGLSQAASVFVRLTNVLDTRYSTFGALGDATRVLGAAYDSPRFLGPAAPRAFFAGTDLRY
jgi:iron complex outermembrane receptor protein